MASWQVHCSLSSKNLFIDLILNLSLDNLGEHWHFWHEKEHCLDGILGESQFWCHQFQEFPTCQPWFGTMAVADAEVGNGLCTLQPYPLFHGICSSGETKKTPKQIQLLVYICLSREGYLGDCSLSFLLSKHECFSFKSTVSSIVFFSVLSHFFL